MNDEDASKDRFFAEIGVIADAMIAAHGKDFAMGAPILAARWIAEGKSFASPPRDHHPHQLQ
jgi:hypothetical protein